jgi:hypothetical protein
VLEGVRAQNCAAAACDRKYVVLQAQTFKDDFAQVIVGLHVIEGRRLFQGE